MVHGLQDVNHGPQDSICKFLGAVGGTRKSKDAFYQRLSETEDGGLPSEELPVTLRTFESGKGGSSTYSWMCILCDD